ncbi:MAG: RadC family protein [Lutibacter sp.]
MKSLTIKNWDLDDRPREKLIKKGCDSLSNSELIAILIGSGSKNESAVSLAKRILIAYQSDLSKLSKIPLQELTQFKGIGTAKAVTLMAALELSKRKQLQQNEVIKRITSSKNVFQIMKPILGELPHEEFWILFLNNANNIIETYKQSQGGITGTVVDIRLIFKKAVQLHSVGLIICHNHPSGKLNPSIADKQLTEKINNAAKILDIKLLDHIIITENDYFSFADEGLLTS